jgi:threonine dehydratase
MSTVTAPSKSVVTPASVEAAAHQIYDLVQRTPLEYSPRLSKQYGAKIYLKREDQQVVRSYKLRGAYNLMKGLTSDERSRGAVTASAGNHAQGVALAAATLQIQTAVYVPTGTPPQKVNRIRYFGGQWVDVRLSGSTFDDALSAATLYANTTGSVFVHPFDDPRVISGQGTVGHEIHESIGPQLDMVIVPVGGGGLASGLGTYLKSKRPDMELIGVEPAGAPSMKRAIEAGHVVRLDHIDKFVDGAAVQSVGKLTFQLASKLLDSVVLVPEGKTCTTMIELYQNEGIVTEPAGALAASALDVLRKQVFGKTVVVVISGGNNDILRYPEIMERSLAHEGLKHYLLIEFQQKPGELRRFVDQALGPNDDITRFEYIKKTNKDDGSALIGIEVSAPQEFLDFKLRLTELGIEYKVLMPSDLLYSYLV